MHSQNLFFHRRDAEDAEFFSFKQQVGSAASASPRLSRTFCLSVNVSPKEFYDD